MIPPSHSTKRITETMGLPWSALSGAAKKRIVIIKHTRLETAPRTIAHTS
jgi:hypothetical protein